MLQKIKHWVVSKLLKRFKPKLWELSFINNWAVLDDDGIRRYRFQPFMIIVNECEGPPKCHAYHVMFVIVVMNLGFELSTEWGGDNADAGEAGQEQADRSDPSNPSGKEPAQQDEGR